MVFRPDALFKGRRFRASTMVGGNTRVCLRNEVAQGIKAAKCIKDDDVAFQCAPTSHIVGFQNTG